MAQHHITPPQLEPVAFVFLLLNDSPAFPPTSSRQILQLYCPDSRAAGAQATKGREGRGAEGGGGRVEGLEVHARGRMVSREIREEGTEPLAATTATLV